jgi:hypothetical protein
MVFYIIACNKEGQSEDGIHKIVSTQVLKEANRTLGDIYPLTNSVSGIFISKLFLGGQNPIQSGVS